MVQYLTVDQIISINADQDGGVGVQNLGGVETNTYRPQSGFGDHETFPDLWTKAAAYLHGFASTQYFTDGNKRTAWYSAVTFLRLNGIRFPRVDDIEAEAFINAVALDAWKADGESATIVKAAEWFHTKYHEQRVGPPSDPKLEYILLAKTYFVPGDGRMDLMGAGLYAEGTYQGFPVPTEFVVVGRYHWNQMDTLAAHEWRATVVAENPTSTTIDRASVSLVTDPAPQSGHTHHISGVLPLLFFFEMAPIFHEPVDCNIIVTLDDNEIARIPYRLFEVPAVPASPAH